MKNKQIEMHRETGSIINEHQVCKCPVTSNLIKLSALRGLQKKACYEIKNIIYNGAKHPKYSETKKFFFSFLQCLNVKVIILNTNKKKSRFS